MSIKNYDYRTKSFKKGAHCFEWPHKHLSKVGMARSFYYYQPTTGHEDRVYCSNCEAVFDSWGTFSAQPIQRHFGVNPNCFVAKLGELSCALSKGELTLGTIETICFSSFQGVNCRQSQALANQGFHCVPEAANDIVSVGCIACLCYPQLASRRPKHTSHCILAACVTRLAQEAAQDNEIARNRDYKTNGESRNRQALSSNIIAATKEAAMGEPENEHVKTRSFDLRKLAMCEGKVTPGSLQLSPLYNLPIEEPLIIPGDTYKEPENPLNACNNSIVAVLMSMVDKVTQETELELEEAISRLQLIIMEGLKCAHHENINAVTRESDRVISGILKGVHEDLKALSVT